MSALSRGGWLTLFQRLTPPSPDSDADLLARFLRDRSEAALDILIRRYAGMVIGVCRRRLGDTPDADDAFQATYLVLAKKAASISRGASLPAWLHRVAYLTSLKLAGQRQRRGTAPMEVEPVDRASESPETIAQRHEATAILDEELAALPEAFRGPVVLCCLEGKTNVEAAAVLGIPVGTVDSRLHAAREKLRKQLIKRGVSGSALGLTIAVGANASDELIQNTVKAALAFAFGGDVTAPVISTLANEVISTMSTSPFKFMAAAMMTTLLAGGIGTGIYFANAGDEPQKPAANAKPAKKDEAKPTKPVNLNEAAETQANTTKSVKEIMVYLDQPITGLERGKGYQIGEIFDLISKKYGIAVRIEETPLKRVGIDNPLEKSVRFDFDPNKITLYDLLNEIITQADLSIYNVSFRVMKNQIVFSRMITVEEKTRERPSLLQTDNYVGTVSAVSRKVSYQCSDLTLEEICDQLRELTSCNIVLDQNNKNINKQKISITLNSTDLFTALNLVSHPCGMSTALMGNVYFITDAKQAEKINRENARALYGEKKPDIVYVPVNREGKFMPPGPDGFRNQKFQFVPVLVEEPKLETPSTTGKDPKKDPSPAK